MDAYRRKSWMWAEACALLDEAERRHRQFFDLLGAPSPQPAWEPPVNVFADGTEVQITIALPGAAAADVSVQLTPTGLQIDALVSPPVLGARMNVVRLEVPYGRMRRRIDLAPGRYAVVERRHEHGCLFLRLTGPAR